MGFLKRLAAGEEGATMVEYALLMSLIAAHCLAAASSIASAVSTRFTAVSAAISGTGS